MRYQVEITRTVEEDELELSDGTTRRGIDQLHHELQAAFSDGTIAGTFRIISPARSEIALGEAETCKLGITPDTLRDTFAKLRRAAEDSLLLLRILGVPSNAAIVTIWRELASSDGSEMVLNTEIEIKLKKLDALRSALNDVHNAMHDARDVANAIDATTAKIDDILNR